MFSPSQADVRQFFCAVWAKRLRGDAMDPLESIAALWIDEHPEYHADLTDAQAAVERQYPIDGASTNPFLHLSMHLSITEQCSVDQPQGIRQAVELLTARKDDLHAAHHEAMECLGEMLWTAQRNQAAPDGAAYVACVQQRATRD